MLPIWIWTPDCEDTGMANVRVEIADHLYQQLEEIARKSGRSAGEELELAVQMYVASELERHVREVIQDPKSPPA
jgi:hypothetical protein